MIVCTAQSYYHRFDRIQQTVKQQVYNTCCFTKNKSANHATILNALPTRLRPLCVMAFIITMAVPR